MTPYVAAGRQGARRPATTALAAAVAILWTWSGAPVGAAVDGPAAQVAAEGPAGKRAIASLVRISLPLTAGADAPLKLTLARARDRLVARAREAGDAARPILVIEIAPAAGAESGGAGSEFEPALALAAFLTSREMVDVQTVAWLPQSVRGHGVLVAMACDEIVMPGDAELGDAGADDQAARADASETMIAAYREIARLNGRIPESVAQSMIDPSVELVQVEGEDGLRLLLRSEVDDYRRDHEVINEKVLFAAGTRARFTGREAWQFGFVRRPAADRAALAQGLAVPLEALNEDQSLLADWRPIMLKIESEITPGMASERKTLMLDRISGGVNWVGIRIDSVGGDLSACLDLASTLAGLDPNTVRTVAYVPVEARGGAAIIALACDQVVLHPGAVLGIGPQPGADDRPPPPAGNALPPLGPRPRPGGPAPPRDAAVNLAAAKASIRDSLAGRTEYGWSLLSAFIDPSIELAAYRNRTTGAQRVMSAEEAGELPDAVNWARGAELTADKKPLALTAAQAAPLGLAWHTVDSYDGLQRMYGLNDVEWVEPDWAFKIVRALASPALASFLLFLGFIGIYIELKTPGVGLGGVVAAVAFLLFFWSKYLDGTAESLEILMFIAGLVLLMVEAFVIPGVGVFGVAGALLVVFSLVLASQTFVVPHSQAELDELAGSIAVLLTAIAGLFALAFVLRRYLPKAPVLNRMMLEPPPPEERITLSHREALADFSHLVGRAGEAVTDLRPAGRALVDDELVDVIAQGEPLDRGTPVIVVSAHANRVVVRKAT